MISTSYRLDVDEDQCVLECLSHNVRHHPSTSHPVLSRIVQKAHRSTAYDFLDALNRRSTATIAGSSMHEFSTRSSDEKVFVRGLVPRSHWGPVCQNRHYPRVSRDSYLRTTTIGDSMLEEGPRLFYIIKSDARTDDYLEGM